MSQSRPLAAPVPTRFRPRWLVLAIGAVLLVIAAGVAIDRWQAASKPAELNPATLRTGFGPATFAAALEHARSNVAGAREGVANGPGEWLRVEMLARALIARFRFAGDYADLAESQRLLDGAIARTPDPAGPTVTRAMHAVLVHRLDQADAALARFARSVAPDDADRADAAALTGDVALQRGALDEAERRFAEAARIAGTPGIGLRGAVLAFQRGDRVGGTRALEVVLARPRQQPAALAEVALQRANFAYAEGDWESAVRWVEAANRLYPGYWLAQVYAAQNEALAGRPGFAIRAYQGIAERTARPEVMDALAHLLRLQGHGAPSRAWAAKAAAGWEARARLFPEAVIHHRAEHELAVGSASRALVYAQTDVAARPQAPNLVLLARALLSAGRAREALAALDRADAQGWVSAGQQMARAETLAALGRTAASTDARARAEAINPRAADPRTRLIWFGHD